MCVNLKTDAANCGACGHSCLQGGTCGTNPLGQTACLPQLLTPSNFTGGQLAISGDSVYVLDYGAAGVNERVWRFSKATGTGVVLTGITGNIFNIATDGNFLYWTTQPTPTTGTVSKANLDGTGITVITPNQNQPGAGAILADSSGVYWVTGLATNGAFDSQIMRLGPKDGNTPIIFVGMRLRIGSIAADANNVYWLTTSVLPDGSDSFVESCTKAQGFLGPVTEIANPVPNATGTGMAITAFNGSVFWVPRGIVSTDGQAWGRLANTTTNIQYASARERPIAVVADANFVYWTDLGNGTDGMVERSTLPSGSIPIPLVTGLISPLSIGLDGQILYFTSLGGTNGASGGLYRLVLQP